MLWPVLCCWPPRAGRGAAGAACLVPAAVSPAGGIGVEAANAMSPGARAAGGASLMTELRRQTTGKRLRMRLKRLAAPGGRGYDRTNSATGLAINKTGTTDLVTSH